ncbi:MAG: hypothetical protein CVV21_04495 [Candidatus Goldiibacteriota bacterium HGW-Goldbacteria-1]|nr:MAG: hypothetical protein CVV21_04495 [Candidatus Goldiibacteriota bacterium HGW-Goldbacteria-1]
MNLINGMGKMGNVEITKRIQTKRNNILYISIFSLIFWVPLLLINLMLLFITNEFIYNTFVAIEFYLGIGMFLLPFIGMFLVWTLADRKVFKILFSLLYIVVFTFLNVQVFSLFLISPVFLSRVEKNEDALSALMEPKRQEVETNINNLKTYEQTLDYVLAAVQRRTNKNDEYYAVYRGEALILIEHIEKNRKVFGDANTAMLLILLDQYSGSHDGEYIYELLTVIKDENPKAVADAKSSVDKYLLPSSKDGK